MAGKRKTNPGIEELRRKLREHCERACGAELSTHESPATIAARMQARMLAAAERNLIAAERSGDPKHVHGAIVGCQNALKATGFDGEQRGGERRSVVIEVTESDVDDDDDEPDRDSDRTGTPTVQTQ